MLEWTQQEFFRFPLLRLMTLSQSLLSDAWVIPSAISLQLELHSPLWDTAKGSSFETEAFCRKRRKQLCQRTVPNRTTLTHTQTHISHITSTHKREMRIINYKLHGMRWQHHWWWWMTLRESSNFCSIYLLFAKHFFFVYLVLLCVLSPSLTLRHTYENIELK